MMQKIAQDEKWIWVEGYKGTDENMCCQNNFQYELNKEFTYDGEISLCYTGFHFCEDLKDVFNYYKLNLYNRYFKVKGLIKEKDYMDLKYKKSKDTYTFSSYIIDSKLVAKQIILLEELKYKDLNKYITNNFPMIENEEDYKMCINYDMFCKDKFLCKMKDLGFSNIFCKILCENLKDGDLLFKYLQQATAYKEENISKDLMIYLLEQYKNKLI